jgi:HTH-type transcriptional regulator/antitoxin HigA
MSYDEKKYGALLATTLPAVIETDEEHDRMLAIIDGLMSKNDDALSPEEERLLHLLADIVEQYERRIYPPLKQSTPQEILNFLMQANGLRQKDLLDVFGSGGIASEVINGKRAISKAQAKKLAERFSVSVELFI